LISPELKDSLLCFESTFAIVENIRDIVLGRLEAFVSRAQGIRTLGSAALTMCYVAMGTVEGYHCDKLMPWDVAAGVLIIREAGGIVIDTDGIIRISEITSTKPSFTYLIRIILLFCN
jgi:myo-inositol-1(or 4)-monophosphatase